jgi:hypothetical protein
MRTSIPTWLPGSISQAERFKPAIRGGASSARPLARPSGACGTQLMKSALDPEGIPANHDSEGLLSPAPVVATVVHRVGKESRHLGSGREVLFSPDHLDYGADDYWPDLLEALSLLGYEPASRAAIAAEVEISTRWLEEITFRKIRPSPNVEARILTAVSARAREWIHEMHSSIELSRTEVGILSQYLELSPSSARRCHECGRLLKGRQRAWCSEGCRKRFNRKEPEQLKLF